MSPFICAARGSSQSTGAAPKKGRTSFYKIGTMARRLSRKVLMQRHSIALGADGSTSTGAKQAAGYAAAALTSLFRQHSQHDLLRNEPAKNLCKIDSMHSVHTGLDHAEEG